MFLQFSYLEAGLEAAKYAGAKIKIIDNLGKLVLGKIDQEYIDDPDIREILANTILDVNKMKPLKAEKLRLIIAVIYSERFELKGNRAFEVLN